MRIAEARMTLQTIGLALLLSIGGVASAPAADLGSLSIQDQGVFFVGGEYNSLTNPASMSGQMYVRFQIPAGTVKPYPVIMIHGTGQQNTTFTGTPDDHPGWTDYFLTRGWPVYVVDQPGRGRAPYISSAYGARGALSITAVENQLTAPAVANLWPQAALHTQWPGTGLHGDPIFDQFYASQFAGMGALPQDTFTTRALVALLDQIGPSILLTHGQSGPHAWAAADARPSLVKAIVAVEPDGPPFYNEANTAIDRSWGITRLPLTFSPAASAPSELGIAQQTTADGPGLFRCWLQTEPARTLPKLAGIPIAIVTGEASFHAQYDHCTSKFLTQAGVKNQHLRLENIGIRGNGHMMMLEKNNGEIAGALADWIIKARGCADLAIAAAAIGSHMGDPRFVPSADLDKNGVIDIRDLAALARTLPAGTVCER